MEQVKNIKPEEEEYITSYDIKALFTSVPVYPTINIIMNKWEQDAEILNGTSMSIPNIIELLRFCLMNTYYLFQSKYNEQVQEAVMGSPISPNVVNLLMDDFEVRDIYRSIFILEQPPQPSAKYSMLNNLTNRARTVCSNLQLLQKEEEHIRGALQRYI